jgi:hypothetical protein
LQNGQGQEKWVDGSSYVGSYVNGKKDGIGLYRWSDGSLYGGEWVENKINGAVRRCELIETIGDLLLVGWEEV